MSKHTELIARALILRRGQILLCQNRKAGYYYLPGGHVEFNESAPTALARELIEEANLSVKVGPLVLVSEHSFKARGKRHHEVNLVFHVEQVPSAPEIASNEPDIAFEWIALSRLPKVDLRPRSVRNWVIKSGATGGKVGWISDLD